MSYNDTNEKLKSAGLIWLTSGTKLATCNVVTKEVKVIGSTGRVMYDIAMSPSGILYGVDSSGGAIFTIDRTTAKATHICTANPAGFINSLTFSQHGALYGCQGTNLVKIHTTTGAVTVIGDMGVGSAGDMVFFNNNLYMSADNDTLLLVDIENPSDSVSIGSIPTTYGLATVYVDEGLTGSFHLYGTSGVDKKIYEINPNNVKISNRTTLPSFGSGDDGIYYGATSSQFTGI